MRERAQFRFHNKLPTPTRFDDDDDSTKLNRVEDLLSFLRSHRSQLTKVQLTRLLQLSARLSAISYSITLALCLPARLPLACSLVCLRFEFTSDLSKVRSLKISPFKFAFAQSYNYYEQTDRSLALLSANCNPLTCSLARTTQPTCTCRVQLAH